MSISEAFFAASVGNVARLRQLLDGGMDANATNEKGKTLLSAALDRNEFSMCVFLLDRGATPPELRDPMTKAVFVWAREKKAPELIGSILKSGPNANIREIQLAGSNETILHQAVWYNDSGFVQFVLDNCLADPDRTDQSGRTALHHAAYRGNIPAIQILRKYVDLNKQAGSAFNGPHKKVQQRHAEAIWNGYTALHAAAEEGHVEVIWILREYADVNKVNQEGFTALHVAAQRGHVEAIKALLRRPPYDQPYR